MSFHYIREPGDEGNVLTGNTAAKGIDLATLLNHTRPPLKVALELAAAVADVLTIAREDNLVHGDLKPGSVRLSSTGAVAVEGFGDSRRTTRAPEGKPVGQETDIYGLGIVLYSLLSPDPLGRLPRTRDQHDSAILSRVQRAHYGELVGQPWLPDVQAFIASVLSFDPAERPDALDVANLLARVASLCGGDRLEAWAGRSIDESGFAPIEENNFEDRLASARTVTGPLALTEAPRVAPAAKGEHSSFWSREKLAQKFGGEEPPLPITKPLRRSQPIRPQSLRAAPTLQGLSDLTPQGTTERFTVPSPAPTMVPEAFDDLPEPAAPRSPQTRQLGPGPRAASAPPPAQAPPPVRPPPALQPPFPAMDTLSEPPAAPPAPPVVPAERSALPPTLPPPAPSALPPDLPSDMPPPPAEPPPPLPSQAPPEAPIGAVMSASTGDAPPEKKKGGALKVVAIIGAVMVVGCLGCSGLGGVLYLMGMLG